MSTYLDSQEFTLQHIFNVLSLRCFYWRGGALSNSTGEPGTTDDAQLRSVDLTV